MINDNNQTQMIFHGRFVPAMMKSVSCGFLIFLCSQLCLGLITLEGSTSDEYTHEESNEISVLYKSYDPKDSVTQIEKAPEEPEPIDNAEVELHHVKRETTGHTCDNRPTGLYADFASGCANYYACISGHNNIYNYSCEHGFRFDRQACACLPKHVVDCHTSLPEDTKGCREHPLTPRPTTKPKTLPPSNFCEGRGPGYYADLSQQCEWFFVCFGGRFQTTQMQCPSHLRFSHLTCRCEYPLAVACTVLDAEPCYPHDHHHHQQQHELDEEVGSTV